MKSLGLYGLASVGACMIAAAGWVAILVLGAFGGR